MSIKRPQHGLTLIEMIIFIVIVSIAVVAVLKVIALNTRNSADPMIRKQALAIAESMMDEVRLAGMTWCDVFDPNVETATSASDCTIPEAMGPEAGNTRPYDNVNDYVSNTGAPRSYTTDVAGNPFPAGYVATVSMTPDFSLGPAGQTIGPGQLNSLQITISVAYTGGSVLLQSYRTRYAPRNTPISPAVP